MSELEKVARLLEAKVKELREELKQVKSKAIADFIKLLLSDCGYVEHTPGEGDKRIVSTNEEELEELKLKMEKEL